MDHCLERLIYYLSVTGFEEVWEKCWSAHQGGQVIRPTDVASLEGNEEGQHCPRRYQARQHPGQRV